MSTRSWVVSRGQAAGRQGGGRELLEIGALADDGMCEVDPRRLPGGEHHAGAKQAGEESGPEGNEGRLVEEAMALEVPGFAQAIAELFVELDVRVAVVGRTVDVE